MSKRNEMIERNRVSFGIKTSQMGLTYEDILTVWREADQIPLIEHAWLWDHMVPLRGDARADALEAWTLLAALAAQTVRLHLGVIVTSNRLRPPAVLAKMAATTDIIAGGRLVFGIGAGGALLPPQHPHAATNTSIREFKAYGIPLVPVAKAIADLAEACIVIKRMWTEREPFDFDGSAYQLTGAVCEPKPLQKPHPPIMIGAGGEKLGLRVVAQHADIWNCPTQTVEEFRHKNDVLGEHCAAIGRDPNDITRSVQLIVRCQDPAEPASTREHVLELINAGVTHIVLAAVACPGPPGHWLAEHIIEPALADMRR
jgi:alkanesulfonate monooxygenase SsuD/methylene tetrahydromethanopterin reductase-like flavin-dependent oxidoreductase (luciferase family)